MLKCRKYRDVLTVRTRRCAVCFFSAVLSKNNGTVAFELELLDEHNYIVFNLQICVRFRRLENENELISNVRSARTKWSLATKITDSTSVANPNC